MGTTKPLLGTVELPRAQARERERERERDATERARSVGDLAVRWLVPSRNREGTRCASARATGELAMKRDTRDHSERGGREWCGGLARARASQSRPSIGQEVWTSQSACWRARVEHGEQCCHNVRPPRPRCSSFSSFLGHRVVCPACVAVAACACAVRQRTPCQLSVGGRWVLGSSAPVRSSRVAP